MPLCFRKNCVQAAIAAGVESVVGTRGYPILQPGGEQEAVTDPAPGKGVVIVQDCRQEEAALSTAGWDEVQVNGILLRTMSLLLFGRELFPITSVRIAVAVCELPFAATKVVWEVT